MSSIKTPPPRDKRSMPQGAVEHVRYEIIIPRELAEKLDEQAERIGKCAATHTGNLLQVVLAKSPLVKRVNNLGPLRQWRQRQPARMGTHDPVADSASTRAVLIPPHTMTQKAKKPAVVRIEIRLPLATLKRIEKAAKVNKCTRSEFLRSVIEGM